MLLFGYEVFAQRPMCYKDLVHGSQIQQLSGDWIMNTLLYQWIHSLTDLNLVGLLTGGGRWGLF